MSFDKWRGVAVAICAVLASAALAQDGGDARPTTSAMADALLGGETALQHRDVRRLMDAAVMLARLHAHPIKGTAVDLAAGGTTDLAVRWAHQAVMWGASPRQLPIWRGRMLGPGYRAIALAPGGQFHTRQVFAGGQKARVEAVALTQGRFSLSVVDDTPRSVCARDGSEGGLACDWVPTFSAPHDIAVQSKQAKPGRFYLVTY